MSKNIIFCADGTWNDSEAKDPTNVLKIFNHLCGEIDPTTKSKQSSLGDTISEMERKYNKTQTAKYINGVGNQPAKIQQLFCGAFGGGVISRIVRGYTFICRNYEEGDQIHLIGFSRGAYTARALGGMITAMGILKKECFSAATAQESKDKAYELATETWFEYALKRKSSKAETITTLAYTVFSNLAVDGVFKTLKSIFSSDKRFYKNVEIKSVAVFDTVGSHGIPLVGWSDKDNNVENGENVKIINELQFADNILHPNVLNGFHAIARDEKRKPYQPSIWDSSANVTQKIFAGAHSDVGGGYPTINNESELSDLTLGWMIGNLSSVGVQFCSCEHPEQLGNAMGLQHQEWANLTAHLLTSRRVIPDHVLEHTSIGSRLHQQISEIKLDYPKGQHSNTITYS